MICDPKYRRRRLVCNGALATLQISDHRYATVKANANPGPMQALLAAVNGESAAWSRHRSTMDRLNAAGFIHEGLAQVITLC
jgi:hypothetical protein